MTLNSSRFREVLINRFSRSLRFSFFLKHSPRRKFKLKCVNQRVHLLEKVKQRKIFFQIHFIAVTDPSRENLDAFGFDLPQMKLPIKKSSKPIDDSNFYYHFVKTQIFLRHLTQLRVACLIGCSYKIQSKHFFRKTDSIWKTIIN